MTDRDPDSANLDRIARAQLATIPEPLRRNLAGVVIKIEDLPGADIVAELGLTSPLDLLGLYDGVSLDRKSSWDMPGPPDMIFLYRRPIISFWRSGGDSLEAIVRHLIIHEAGHHFGFTDVEMEAIEDGV